MTLTQLSSKGQVVIPKNLRAAHGWQLGQSFEVIETDEGLLLKPLKPFKITTLDNVSGCLEYHGKAKSLKEMDAAIKQAVKKRYASR